MDTSRSQMALAISSRETPLRLQLRNCREDIFWQNKCARVCVYHHTHNFSYHKNDTASSHTLTCRYLLPSSFASTDTSSFKTEAQQNEEGGGLGRRSYKEGYHAQLLLVERQRHGSNRHSLCQKAQDSFVRLGASHFVPPGVVEREKAGGERTALSR